MKLAVKTLENKDAGQIDLDESVFGIEVKNDILHRAVHWQRNKSRSGTHKTKDVSEVAGSGKKPHAQKGTGHAVLCCRDYLDESIDSVLVIAGDMP